MRAFTVCVDYAPELAITLPYNRHHFSEMVVVTSFRDEATMEVVRANGVNCFRTDAFYDNGADFNKWLALEDALTAHGREGWICLLDADVLWPKVIQTQLEIGNLYAPLRRMCPTVALIPEHEWWRYPIHRNINEWAGYSQIFHGSDSVLPKPPWHEVDWRHAGGADSFFQAMWPLSRRMRPQWDVLHMGEAGVNWCGRSVEAKSKMVANWYERRRTHRFDHEKL